MSAEEHEELGGGHEATHEAAPAAPHAEHAKASHARPEAPARSGHGVKPASPAASQATPHQAQAAQGAKSPIANAYAKARSGLTSTASNVVATTSKFGAWARKVLRAEELEPVQDVGLLKTPVYAAGQVIDGTALNIGRRAMEVVEPTVQGLRALWRSTIGIILSPIESLKHPIQTLKNPIRIVTSQAMMSKNMLMAPLRAAHEFIDRSITRTVEQINTQVKKVPILSQIIASPTNFIAGITSKISAAIKNTLDWVTSPIDHIHNAVAPA